MDYITKQLQKNNIHFQEYPHYAEYFRKRWEDAFVQHLSTVEKKAIYLHSDRYFCGYLWHVFSWKKTAALEGIEASKAFEAIKKAKCYCFHQRLREVLVIENAQALTAEHFQDEEDVYIVDEHFTWTYVVTHECDLGPYFKARTTA